MYSCNICQRVSDVLFDGWGVFSILGKIRGQKKPKITINDREFNLGNQGMGKSYCRVYICSRCMSKVDFDLDKRPFKVGFSIINEEVDGVKYPPSV